MKATVFIGTSLDGFIARKNGDIDWLVQYANDEAVHAYEEFISRIDAVVIGRGTFEKVLSFPEWPYKINVFLLSRTMLKVPDKVREKVSILSMKPGELLHYLSGQGYSRVYVDGGMVIQDFLKEDLIDELIISKAPVLIGSGIPLFGHLDIDLQFKHISTDVYSNGLVRSSYERKR
jgi:dihydrofolate reductase